MNEQAEFEQLFKSQYTTLYYIALQLVGDEETSRDIVSDAFEYICNRFEEITYSGAKSYLRTLVKSKSLDFLRHRQVEEKYIRLSQAQEVGVEERNWQREELRERIISETLEHLPERTRKILTLCYMQHHSYQEAATLLGISVSAIGKHINRALTAFRRNLAENNILTSE